MSLHRVLYTIHYVNIQVKAEVQYLLVRKIWVLPFHVFVCVYIKVYIRICIYMHRYCSILVWPAA